MTQPISADQPIAESHEGKMIVTAPWFRFFVDLADVDLTADVSGVLPVVNGGTGTTTSTGTGDVVLSNGGLLSSALLSIAQFINGFGFYPFAAVDRPHINANDTNLVSVTGVATTIVPGDKPMFFVIHDKTSGGMTVGVMDGAGVVIPVAFAGIANVTFSRAVGTGLQATVTGGANPRSLSTFAIATGTL